MFIRSYPTPKNPAELNCLNFVHCTTTLKHFEIQRDFKTDLHEPRYTKGVRAA